MELSEQTPLPKTEKPKSRLGFRILIITLNLLILTVLAVGVYFLFFNKAEKKNSETKKQASSSASKKTETKYEAVYVSAEEGLNLREKPSTDSDIILLLPYGTELKIFGTEGDWYFVQAQTKGFVAKEFTTTKKPTITIKTFSDPDSPFNFLYHDVYKVDFTKKENTLEYSFTGNDSFGGFKVDTEEGLQTLGNYALQKYPGGKRSSCGVRFGAGKKECEKVEDENGTTYLVLVNARLYKFTYLKTEGGLLEDLKNIVFYSLFFK